MIDRILDLSTDTATAVTRYMADVAASGKWSVKSANVERCRLLKFCRDCSFAKISDIDHDKFEQYLQGREALGMGIMSAASSRSVMIRLERWIANNTPAGGNGPKLSEKARIEARRGRSSHAFISGRLSDFMLNSYFPLRLRGRSENARRLLRVAVNNFEMFLQRPADLTDLTDDTVSRYMDWARRRPPNGRSPHTVNRDRGNLLALWRFACRRQGPDGYALIRDWPNVLPDIEPEDDPVAWSVDQLRTLFEAMKQVKGSYTGIPAGAWWTALHHVLWDTGERIGAVLQVQWQNVDLAGRYLNVPAVTRKGGQKGRTYRLHADTTAALEVIQMDRPHSASVFPWPKDYHSIFKFYKNILKTAGLPHDRKRGFHCMRRSFASHAEAAGLNATELLGHSNRKVTKAYLDPRIVVKSHASDILFRPQGSASKKGGSQ